MRLLVLAPYAFANPRNGGQIRIWNLLRRLVERGHAIDYWYASDPTPLEEFPSWDGLQVRQYPGAQRDSIFQKLRMAVGRDPEAVAVPFDASMFDDLQRLDLSRYDVVVLEHAYMAKYLKAVSGRIPIVLTAHNVESVLFAQISRYFPRKVTRWRHRIDALKMERSERTAWDAADLVVAVSENDAAAVRQACPHARVVVHPNGVDLDYFRWSPRQAHAAHRVLLTGTLGYVPNLDAAHWIAADILPRIRRQLPDVRVSLVGSAVDKTVEELASEFIEVHGNVPDVRPFMARSDVFLMPLRIGSGTRLKALEALAAGIPIVSTSLGVEGIGAAEEGLVLLAETAGDLADATVHLMQDIDLRQKMSLAGRRFVESRYDWDVIAKGFEDSLTYISGKR